VSRSFGALTALDNVDLVVEAGERRGILGANGAGKTTLFNAITGDFPPTSGRIRFFGEDVTRLPAYERIRRGLRRTYQNSMLFRGLVVLDNLYLAACGVSRGRLSFLRPRDDDAALQSARDLAHAVHLDGVAEQLVSELSHGQQRQLEIGMALAGDPKILLLDEPTSGMSPAETVRIIDLIASLPRTLAILMIEHDMKVVFSVADRVTVLYYGKILATGTPDEIQANTRVREVYLGMRH
jgi:branched-chain amino acid transport system ATP-binding protein